MAASIRLKFFLLLILLGTVLSSFGQDYQIKTLIKGSGHRASGAYGALSNKFTTINGEFANMAEVYGGWYINHRFLLGISVAAVTNNIPVPAEFSSRPGVDMSYEYGQLGLMTEYTLWSHKAVHLSFHMMNGVGSTVQYQRYPNEDNYWDENDDPSDANCFFVSEPGVKLEMNILKWLRFSPGISYRAAFGSDAEGLSDGDISGTSLNLTLKFGKF